MAQTFTGTGGIQATDLVDLNTFSTANVQGGGAAPTGNSNVVTTAEPASQATPTPVKACKKKPAASQSPASNGNQPSTASGNNVQTFTGTLGGPPPPVISGTGNRPFSVNGDTFVNAGAALQRSCDVQHNACANAANSGKLSGGVGQCDQQNNECRAAASGASNNAGNNNSNNGNAGNNNGDNGAGNNTGSDNTGNDNTGNGNTGGNTGNFGSCSNPSIKFANGLDGRKEAAFAPVDQTDFNHGSALNIKIIADFICDRLNDQCKAGAAVVAKCQSASAAASQQKGQAAADAFNQALGVSSN